MIFILRISAHDNFLRSPTYPYHLILLIRLGVFPWLSVAVAYVDLPPELANLPNFQAPCAASLAAPPAAFASPPIAYPDYQYQYQS